MAVNGTFNIPVTCHKGKKSTIGIYWDAASDAQLTAIFNSLQAISLGTFNQAYLQERTDKDAGATTVPPGTASRGKKFVVKYTDTVTQKLHQIEVPGGDDTLLASSDEISLTAGEGLAIKTAMDAGAVSPDGNPVSVYMITFDTRNIE